MHEDARVEAFDVIPPVHHFGPPGLPHVVLELHAEGSVVVDGADATVDLGGLEDEPAPLREGYQLLHKVLGVARVGAHRILHDSLESPGFTLEAGSPSVPRREPIG